MSGSEVAAVLRRTAPAHHQAFLATDGRDPDWPLWYAEHTLEELRRLLDPDLTLSEATYLFVAADRRHRAEEGEEGEEEWATFYARVFLAEAG